MGFRFLRIVGLCTGLLLLAPAAEAQFIGCDPATNPCTDTLYGLGFQIPGQRSAEPSTLALLNTRGSLSATRGTGGRDGSCGPEQLFNTNGQIRLREQDNCVVSATNRCVLEIPDIDDDSGTWNNNRADFDFGAGGFLSINLTNLTQFSGNLGFRQLSGTCSLDAGEECALDSDCPSGTGCLSTCFSDPGTSCSGHADCANADCVTEIEWDGIGRCTDDVTVCNTTADCPGAEVCLAGLELRDTPNGCLCCQSTSGALCPAVVGFAEYPAITCPVAAVAREGALKLGGPDWIFEGGRGTNWDMESVTFPNQQESVCRNQRSRPCGAVGDRWAGSDNDKCENGGPSCPEAFDPDNPSLPSACDDVAFGGLAGDFCDFEEQGLRFAPYNPDGTPNTTLCVGSFQRYVGTVNEYCTIPVDIPDGDPQPGCRLFNMGLSRQADFDCNGIDDTEEGRCMPEGGAICERIGDCPSCAADGDCASGNCINNGDMCPFLAEFNQLRDLNNDDIGDECQCGDGNGDGAVTGIDISATALCANDPFSSPACDATIVDATGDNATTAEDIGGIVAAVNGTITTADLTCIRNLDTTLP